MPCSVAFSHRYSHSKLYCAFVLPLHTYLSDQNPVLVIDQQVLEDEVQRIGEPVSAFLTSDEFTSVVPEDVQVMKISFKKLIMTL